MHTDAFILNDENGSVYEKLALLPSYGLEVLPEFAELIHDLGDGYQAVAQMGDSRGIEYFTFKFNAVTQTTSQSLIVDEQGNTMQEIVYLRDFVMRKRRAVPFYITHPITKIDELVVIAQYQSYQLNNPSLWACGLVMKTWHGAGDSADNTEFNESSDNNFTI